MRPLRFSPGWTWRARRSVSIRPLGRTLGQRLQSPVDPDVMADDDPAVEAGRQRGRDFLQGGCLGEEVVGESG